MHTYILVVAFLLVDVAHTGPLSRPSMHFLHFQSAMNNNPIILSYKTDTHSRHETGIPGRSVQGSYSYIAGDGRWYKVTYIADERGYRAKSEQLPLPVSKPVISSTLSPVQLSDKPAPVFQNVQTVTVSTLIKKDDLVVDKEEEQIKKFPAAITQITHQKEESSVTMKDDHVLKSEKQPTKTPSTVPAMIEPTEKLAIHVPLFTKVYSLNKSTKYETKHRKTKAGSPSRIIRYKLSFLPSYGLVMH